MTKKKDSTVLWWIGWIVLTILSFFVACFFWTGFIADHVGAMSKQGVPVIWVASVFGSWMILLIPLIIVMYNKVDRAYEDTRIAREGAKEKLLRNEFGVRSIYVDEAERRLSKELTQKLNIFPEAIKKGHLVTALLRDGREIENVFVFNKTEILGIYDRAEMPFSASDIADIRPADLDKLPVFESQKWLRLDGVGA